MIVTIVKIYFSGLNSQINSSKNVKLQAAICWNIPVFGRDFSLLTGEFRETLSLGSRFFLYVFRGKIHT